MVRKDGILMSGKEWRRLHLIQQAIEKKITQKGAGEVLELTDRQIRRMVKRVRKEGESGVKHGSYGKPSHRQMDVKVKVRVLKVYEKQYADFGPTLASEKLFEREKISISDETLRLWLLEAGVTHFQRRNRPHRQWRERKAHAGELIQMDGSHHKWLEDRGGVSVLMAYIDDATGKAFARFYGYEGTIPAMDSFKRYVKEYGLPQKIYSDRHTTYKSPAEPTIKEQLEGVEAQSQFQRSLSELGVEMIHAHSPQAKGRIERLFGTFQDRLVKEMRLAGIATMEEANRFLVGYLPIYNKRFCVEPLEPADLHRPISDMRDLDRALCIKTERALHKDFTVAHNKVLYQIQDNPSARRVMVEERLDGTTKITHQGNRLRYRVITTRPVKEKETLKIRVIRRRPKPAPDHPWRRNINLKKKEASASIN